MIENQLCQLIQVLASRALMEAIKQELIPVLRDADMEWGDSNEERLRALILANPVSDAQILTEE